MHTNIKVVGSFLEIPSAPPSPRICDIIEVRLDALFTNAPLTSFLDACAQEKLFTVRDIKEGGANSLTTKERISKLEEFLSLADYIDVEMRNWGDMTPIINSARSSKTKTICSYHNFQKTPSFQELETLLSQAQELNTDIIKFAFMTHSLDDIKVCQDLLFKYEKLDISIMGMGAYAPVSRILLAQSGSVLNYGYLGETVTAPGQWSAELLKSALSCCEAIS